MGKTRTFIKKLIKEKGFILIFLLAGFIFRLNMISFVVNDPRYDIRRYSELAEDILAGRLAIDCCYKNSGYPFFLAPIYWLFGDKNFYAVGWIQIVLDLVSGILLHLIAKRVFSTRVAHLVFVLYMINPFTAAYTGLVLPETLTIFGVVLIGYILIQETFFSRTLLWFFVGLLFGLLAFVRTQFMQFGILFTAVTSFFSLSKFKRIGFIGLVSLGFLLASLYSLNGYYKKYNVVSIGPPYAFPSLSLYLIFYRKGPYPEIAEDYTPEAYEDERHKIYMEFSETPIEKYNEFNSKYLKLFKEKVKSETPLFVTNYVKSIFWIWNKRHLFYYEDHLYRYDSFIVQIINICLIVFWGIGVIGFIVANKIRVLKQPFFLFSVLLFLYITFVFPLVSAESRHTIFYTGILILWAGYGITLLHDSFIKALIRLHFFRRAS